MARQAGEEARRRWRRSAEPHPQSDEGLWAVLDTIPDGVIVVDEAGTISFVNAQATALFGYGRDEMLGNRVEMLLPDRFKTIHPHHRDEYAESPRVRPMGAYLDLHARHSDGREIPVEIALSPLETSSGRFFLATVRDITDRIHMHEELKRANEAVKASLERTRAAYEREHLAAKRLMELDELKNEFIGIVAHDLRSPMATIGGFATTMLESWDRLDDDRRRRILEIIVRNVEDMNELVTDILDVAQIESGNLALAIAPFDLGAVVRQVASEVAATLNRACDLSIPDNLPNALGDVARQRQVLGNLLSNAFKYSGAGTVVEVGAAVRGRLLAVTVRDHGIGISPDDHGILFHKFSRIRSLDGAQRSGTGLGLFICKSLVEAQGGTITAESEPGKGSAFTYTIPRA